MTEIRSILLVLVDLFTIMQLPHFSNLHEGYVYQHIPIIGRLVGSRIRQAMDNTVDQLNQDLSGLMTRDQRVTMINSGQYINHLARSTEYQQSVSKGGACINDSFGQYTKANPGGRDCAYRLNTQAYYFSWNNAHYTSPLNQELAQYVNSIIKQPS